MPGLVFRSVEAASRVLIKLPPAASKPKRSAMTRNAMTRKAITSTQLLTCAATLVMLSIGPAAAAPAYVLTTVNLRAGAGTNNEIVAKIAGGSLIDATNCTEWCEVEWQGKKGFAIASAIDRSGRVPIRRAAPRIVDAPEEYAIVAPPRVYYRPPVYYYGYRPYYWGYRRWRY
jgi:uncharacterized protein YraI